MFVPFTTQCADTKLDNRHYEENELLFVGHEIETIKWSLLDVLSLEFGTLA